MTIPDSKTIKYKRECQSNVIKTKKLSSLPVFKLETFGVGSEAVRASWAISLAMSFDTLNSVLLSSSTRLSTSLFTPCDAKGNSH